ncbi:MAG TPA: phage tail sheath C-terminal domain-containing protein [Pyrinomonadaceae bacterium]|jgi:phage tail sheath protein FI|nr:phage tail sheath C-terminal domain-containing protein [Pyrinomonadaceae bacterium]
MPNYLTPGVYIEEVSTGTRPIEAVGTSTAAFIGVAPKEDAPLHQPLAVNNWTQFVTQFIGTATASTYLSNAVYGFFQNGGSRCYVVNVGKDGSLKGDGKGKQGIDSLESVDEVAIVAAPGYTDLASYNAVLDHCNKMLDRVAILDAPENVADIDQLKVVASGGKTKKPAGDAPDTGGDKSGMRPPTQDKGFGSFYFPWLSVADPLNPKGDAINVPPSGHMAGIYARTDATRGVHKAPANEVVRGALDLTYRITPQEQGELNTNGVNCIRFFPTQGIRVWGARTLADAANEWRYINVRRLFNMIEESISRGTRWVVFEPNDMTLWKGIKRDISAFLTLQWRQGALMGATPEEAFFVQCDAETNPPEVIDAGQVVAVIGIAPVKPAEFVIFRIGQSAGGTQVETA